MYFKKNIFLLFFAGIISSFAFALETDEGVKGNPVIDSLEKQLDIEKSNGKKISLLGDICWEYLLTGNFEKAIDYGNKELAMAKDLNDDNSAAQAYSDLGSVYYSQGDYQKAIKNYTNSLQIREKIKDTLGAGKNYNNLGAVYQRQGDNSKALEYYLKSMKVFEKTDNKKAIHAIFNNIADIYRYNKDYGKALEYFRRSLKIKEELGDKYQIAATQSNIGMIYGDQGKTKEALEVFQKSYSIQKEIDDKVGMASSLLNIGILYKESGDFSKSLQYYNSSLEISLATGDKHTIGLTFNGIGTAYLELKEYMLAIENYQKGLAIGKESGSKETIMKSYQGLAAANSELKNFEKAYEFHQLYSLVKDSIFNEESSGQIAEMQTRYETKEKENEILLLNKDKEIANAESKKQRLIIWSVLGGLFFVIIFAGFVWRSLRITKRQKSVIEKQKEIVDKQRKTVEEKNLEISHKNKELTDSINYAQRIQSAILTSEQYLNDMFLPQGQIASHFILYKPKDIVAGDFYWAFKTQSGKAIWLAADCTGHGVPGAFMSMIGNSLLNEIVLEKGIEEPDEILNQLRAGVIKALGQSGSGDKFKDGMDAALCCWDKTTNKLSFAGANNCLWIARQTSEVPDKDGGGEVIEIKPDSQPVGQHIVMNPFTKREFRLQKGDTIYSFTDGFCDQFGGPKGKKFKYKPFKELLLSIQNKSMGEQKSIINRTIVEWMGEMEQVDDICVFGVRV